MDSQHSSGAQSLVGSLATFSCSSVNFAHECYEYICVGSQPATLTDTGGMHPSFSALIAAVVG